MKKGIHINELKKLEGKTVPARIITLGKVLQDLEGLSRRDALWVLRQALRQLGA